MELNLDKHIGFPLPSEMFHSHMNKKIEVKSEIDKWQKTGKISIEY